MRAPPAADPRRPTGRGAAELRERTVLGRPPRRTKPLTAAPATDWRSAGGSVRELRPMAELTYTFLKLLPRNTLSRALGAACRIPAPRPVMRAVIRGCARRYGVDAAEAERAIEEYPTFTEFFTRRLKPGARPIAPGERVPVSPVDGTVGEVGDIVEGRLLQAKGKHYTLAGLFGGPHAEEDARRFAGGSFVTIYLAPCDYHRIHAPLGGSITGYINVPGPLPPVKGTRDVLPGDTYLKKDDPWIRTGHLHLIEQAARDLFPLYGYREARTPVLERTSLFARGIGDATDIVAKEMYTFEDRDGTQVSMRPEGTASLVRAYVEHAVQQQEPETKWWYAGPMFRHERQQRGRYRQFTQIGVEALGSAGPRIDAEQIEMLDRWLRALGVPFEMHVNTLGDARCRPAYRTALQQYLREHSSELCEDCKKRVETNPIRVLDCKNPQCQAVAARAPKMEEFLCAECREHFEGLRAALACLGVAHVVDPKLVRGLDYYTRTTYEAIATSGLGSQSTVAGGGRYDGLVRELGGGEVPGIGFAAGVERLALLVAQAGREAVGRPLVFLAPLGPEEDT